MIDFGIDLDGNMDFEKDLRILLIGRTGSGKSATGNTILGGNEFKSYFSLSSVTQECECKQAIRDGMKIQVVDTPSFFYTKNDFTQKDVEKCVGLLSPGPHAIIFVIKLEKFTKELNDTIKKVKYLFRNEGKKFLIILFTHKDELDAAGNTLDEFLNGAGQDCKDIVSIAGNRCIAFNNKAEGEEMSCQLLKLREIVQDLVSFNGGCYTKELFNKDRPFCPIL